MLWNKKIHVSRIDNGSNVLKGIILDTQHSEYLVATDLYILVAELLQLHESLDQNQIVSLLRQNDIFASNEDILSIINCFIEKDWVTLD